MKGTILGVRPYRIENEETGRVYSGHSVCVARDPSEYPDGQQGQAIDVFSVPERASGSYLPSVGDAVLYHLYRENGRQKCGFLLPDPEG